MNSKTVKIVAGLVGFVMAFSLVLVPSAGAATVAELQAQINALLAQLQGLQGGVSTTFTMDLTVGSTGPEVVALQSWLEKEGLLVLPVGTAKGYFGALTKAALAKWQAANGISPAAGYFGPITRAAVNAKAGPVAPVKPMPSLSGDEGSISDVNELSEFNNEEVGDGEEDVEVLGFEIEASNDGDIDIRSIKVSFDPAGNTGSDNLDDYIESVSVWMGGEEVGSADVDDFTQNSSDVFTKIIALDDSVVEADETEEFTISVNAANNIDSADISGDSWTVDVDSIRFEDGSGVVTTDTSTGDIDGMDVPINFVSFSTAADTELKISSDSDSPEAGIVVIDNSDNTDDVELLKGELELEGTSDVVIDEIPVTLTTVGGANVAAVTGTLTLNLDGKEYTESVTITAATTGTVTFDNLDFDMEAGDTVGFTVTAEINDIDAGTLDEGDTLVASITSTNRDYIDAENTEGDQLSDSSEKSGTAIGEAQEFRTAGISLDLVSTNTSVTSGTSASDDLGTFVIKFKVTAVGETVYVSTLADAQLSGNTVGKTTVLVDRAGTATVGGVTATVVNVTDTDLNATGLYEIQEGESETFELTTTVQLPAAGQGGQFRAVLGGVRWDDDSTDATPDNSYTSNLDDLKTSYVGLN